VPAMPVSAKKPQPSGQLSQPIPSLSPSKPCGSGGTTAKRRNETSPQFRSGGYGGMHTPG
jgi:hypothetical protein